MFDPLSIELRDNMILLSRYKPTDNHSCNCEHCNIEGDYCPYCEEALTMLDMDE